MYKVHLNYFIASPAQPHTSNPQPYPLQIIIVTRSSLNCLYASKIDTCSPRLEICFLNVWSCERFANTIRIAWNLARAAPMLIRKLAGQAWWALSGYTHRSHFEILNVVFSRIIKGMTCLYPSRMVWCSLFSTACYCC